MGWTISEYTIGHRDGKGERLLSYAGNSVPPLDAGGGIIDHESELLDLAVEATARNARLLRVRVQDWLRSAGALEAVIEDLGLAVYEALANAVEHAYHPHHHQPVVQLQAWLDQDQVVIIVSDRGRWHAAGDPGYRGRGLTVMRHLVSEVDLIPTAHGTTVRLRASLRHTTGGGAPAVNGGRNGTVTAKSKRRFPR